MDMFNAPLYVFCLMLLFIVTVVINPPGHNICCLLPGEHKASSTRRHLVRHYQTLLNSGFPALNWWSNCVRLYICPRTRARVRLLTLAIVFSATFPQYKQNRKMFHSRAHAHTHTPVSYTHLDVYKRQTVPTHVHFVAGKGRSEQPAIYFTINFFSNIQRPANTGTLGKWI